MDPLLKPKCFDADPDAPDALKRWNHWYRTFTSYLTAVGDSKHDKLETLVYFLDPSIYDHIAECKDYDSAIETLQKMYVRPQSVIYARHLLATCKQENGQDVDQFVLKLKSLAKACDFKAVSAVEHINESIRDALITGLQSVAIREKLLAQQDLSLDEAQKMARSLELAHKQSQTYTCNPSLSCSLTQNNIQATTEPCETFTRSNSVISAAVTQKCYFCGYSRHPRSKCPAREAICRACGKTGHFERSCKSKNTKQHILSAVGPLLSTLITAAAPSSLSRSITTILVNGVSLQALIDTGSSCSYMSPTIARIHDLEIFPNDSVITMASTNLSCAITGYCFANIQVKDEIYQHFKLYILPNLCADVLLGHDFLGLHGKLEIPFGGKRGVLRLCGLTAVKIESPPLFSNLSPDCKPIATKSRRHAPDDDQFIRSEVDHLLKDGIIEPSTSPWRAQVLVTKNLNHKRRMVVDYSQTINRFTYLDAYPLPRLDEMIECISQECLPSDSDSRK
jgi:hypothetical protein